MSLARIYTTKRVQKDWTCGKCGKAIKKGQDGRISFAVGFRGREQTRCTDAACRPTRSELESSAVATVYGAQDDVDYDSLETLDDLTEARDSVADAADEVADEYEQNEMFEINEDLQERAQILHDAADALREWEPEGEAPEEEKDCDECEGTGEVEDPKAEEGTFRDCDECNGTGKVDADEDSSEWLQEARDSLQAAIDEMELP